MNAESLVGTKLSFWAKRKDVDFQSIIDALKITFTLQTGFNKNLTISTATFR